QSMVYVERKQSDGRVRRGLVGAIDLAAYDYSSASTSPVRATEGTVESRLPPRVAVRSLASLEMPHVMVLADDPEKLVIEALAEKKPSMEKLYDFDLMLGGGHLTGWLVSGKVLEETIAALDELGSPEALKRRYGDVQYPMLFAMGDGNHSLATAKLCWERIRSTLSPAELETCPARYGLVELVNVHDEAIDFEPIHRVLFDTNADAFLEEAAHFWEAHSGSGHTIGFTVGRESLHLDVSGFTIGQLIGAAEDFCQNFLNKHGGRIDYVHGTETAEELGRQPGCCAVLLPAMDKSELFPSVMRSGAFPRKSFSIGHAPDKRYYLECRRIR
ncbi:MAG: DUF1015 domain-containing protein, partial [Eubacteriales bacterium]|nr:DUF1015 domain-containing protein [Eubacteriales bacterium]